MKYLLAADVLTNGTNCTLYTYRFKVGPRLYELQTAIDEEWKRTGKYEGRNIFCIHGECGEFYHCIDYKGREVPGSRVRKQDIPAMLKATQKYLREKYEQ